MMDGADATALPAHDADVYYPASDGMPMAETPTHVLQLLKMVALLRHHYRRQTDVYVIGNIFWYYEQGNPKARRSPDVMVVKGVDAARFRRSFKSWEEDANPSLVIEMTSQETADEDLVEKKALYERLNVREYFLFDPLGEYLPRPLIGFRRILGKYEELMPGADGRLHSTELGMWLVPNGPELDLYNYRTDEKLLDLPDMADLLLAVRQELDQTEKWAALAERHSQEQKQRADAEQQRADTEKQRADTLEQQLEQERRRAEEMAAELARLRALLPPAGPPA